MKLLVLCVLALAVQQVYSCTAKNCKTCASGTTTKCQTCNVGFYKLTAIANGCEGACSDGCASCTSSFSCLTCKSAYYMNDDLLCMACPNGCSTCSSTTNGFTTQISCGSCQSGFEPSGQVCSPSSASTPTETKTKTPRVVLTTVPFAAVMITLVLIAYFMQSCTSYPDPSTIYQGGQPSPTGFGTAPGVTVA